MLFFFLLWLHRLSNKTAMKFYRSRLESKKASTRISAAPWSGFNRTFFLRAPRNFARLLRSWSRRLTRNLMIAERRYSKGSGTKLAATSERTSIWGPVVTDRAVPSATTNFHGWTGFNWFFSRTNPPPVVM